MKLPTWMRVALLATAVMNIVGAIAFAPLVANSRELLHLPAPVHPLYLWIIAEFILIFGIAYAWCAITARAPRLFIAVGAAGKLLFFATRALFWLAGELPLDAALGGIGDLLFGGLFLAWLVQSRAQQE
jgi:hypothetical protein